MSKIKIMTGWSNPGGSTMSLMEVCDLFNERGYDCTMYGPHTWFLDKCEGARLLGDFVLEDDDIIIGHFMDLPDKPPQVKKLILSCHEKSVFVINAHDVKGADAIRYISEDQMHWQGVLDKPGVVIPNLVRGVEPSKCNEEGIAGIIGTISHTKGVHTSIDRALADGCKEVHIYGNITEPEYFQAEIVPRLADNVIYHGLEQDRQVIYDSISVVYQSNIPDLPEAFGRVRAECIRAGIEYRGNEDATCEFELWDEDDAFEAWKDLLEL